MSSISYDPNLTHMPKPVVFRRSLIAFVVVLVTITVAAIARISAVNMLGLHLKKDPVPTRKPLINIGSELGSWLQVNADKKLNPDLEHELGTTEYIMREYVDLNLLPEVDVKLLRSLTLSDREKVLSENGKMKVDPKSRIRVALTYYTGSVDTVPHVPERCFAADGWTPDRYDVVNWAILPREQEKDRYTDVRMMSFENQISVTSTRTQHVCYFFQVNGEYEQDAIFGVRKRLQNIWESKSYFAKIELATGDVKDPDEAHKMMKDFLVQAMPEIERVLPDWKAVNAADKK